MAKSFTAGQNGNSFDNRSHYCMKYLFGQKVNSYSFDRR